MYVNQVSSVVLYFEPKIVYPYRYRGKPNFSDINEFNTLVCSENKGIDVRLSYWCTEI